MKRVVIESPFAGSLEEVIRNIKYARACVKDSLNRGEAPYASHLFFPQPGILDDNIPKQRRLGIEAGFEITKDFDLTAIYCDLGVTSGMLEGIKKAHFYNRPIEERFLGEDWEKGYEKQIKKHSHKVFLNTNIF
jgi:hypothetical protein